MNKKVITSARLHASELKKNISLAFIPNFSNFQKFHLFKIYNFTWFLIKLLNFKQITQMFKYQIKRKY